MIQDFFGLIASDPDPEGNSFRIDGLPRCPTCGGAKPSSWDLVKPAKAIDVETYQLTHCRWASLTSEDKTGWVALAISQV